MFGNKIKYALIASSLVFGAHANAGGAYVPSVKSMAPVYETESELDGSPVELASVRGSWSKIERKSDKLCITTKANNLPEGAFTTWWIIFNEPDNCFGGDTIDGASCTLGDVGNPAADTSALSTAPALVGPRGVGIFDSCLEYGEIPSTNLFGGGVKNSHAEVHILIKWHGKAAFDDYNMLGNQLTKIDGGCDAFIDTDFQGRSHCPDLRMIVHPQL
ncbi:MAG: hypothetical protein COA42_15030 [Alteromonadaceae bacterium]|nr:MAG: hypothetical protein COA42_15030 [Alteromonadaceae bacterium]